MVLGPVCLSGLCWAHFFFFCSVSVCSVAFGLASSLIDCKNVVFVLSMSWSVRILQSHFFAFSLCGSSFYPLFTGKGSMHFESFSGAVV